MKAYWNDKVIAESNDTIVIEGNHYFPPEAISKEFFSASDTHTTCHGKVWHLITRLMSMVRRMWMEPGSIQIQNPQQKRFAIMSRFGEASRCGRTKISVLSVYVEIVHLPFHDSYSGLWPKSAYGGRSRKRVSGLCPGRR